ncbi:hypothetical protein NHJ6243_008793 [Beauveria neobassiana]
MSADRIIFDEDGDAQLCVGSAYSSPPAIFIACSRALSRASPVFDEIFHGTRAQQKTDAVIIDLAHDKPASLALLLFAMHSRFDHVPACLPIDALYDLTVVAQKYGATAALRPWTGKWTQAVAVELEGEDDKLPKAMSIYWALGCRAGFFSTAARFAECAPDLGTTDLADLQIPPDTIEHIIAIRRQTVDLLCNVFRDMIRHLLIVDEGPRWCHHATWFGHHRCESMILGSIMSGLSRVRLWPLPDAKDASYSVLKLYEKLDSVVVHDIARETENGADHQVCNPSQHLKSAMKNIMDGIPDRLSKLIVFKTGQLDLSK